MNSVTIDTTSTYRLKASAVDTKDGELTLIAGINATVTIIAPLNWTISGQTVAVIRNSGYVTLKLNQPKNTFNIIAGDFLAIIPLNNNTIPYPNVKGTPTKIAFTTIANQNDYPFDGTTTAWNPDGLDLTGAYDVFQYFSDGLLKVETVNYTWSDGTLSIIGKVYDDVQGVLFYEQIILT